MKGKSRDPDMLACELFKEDVLGEDLKMSLLMIFNRMKQEITIPECIRTANITMIHKKKSKLDLSNWRGIFVTSVLRTILMKMIQQHSYEKVALSMTDSQIGARKKQKCHKSYFYSKLYYK